jgi:hypothetical protein
MSNNNDNSNNNEEDKKRGRKKKFQIESIKKLRESQKDEDKTLVTPNLPINQLDTQEQISMGSLNLTVYKQNSINVKDLRKDFDNIFGLNSQERAPNVLTQEVKKPSVSLITSSRTSTSTNGGSGVSTNGVGVSTNGGGVSTNVSTNGSGAITKNVHVLIKSFVDKFKESKKWPENSDLLCWWCCHQFTSIPVPCPINYEPATGKYEIKGIFCSWECSAAFSVENYKSLTHIYNLTKCEDIKVAPSKYTLKSFGGYLTIDEFRNIHSTRNNYKVQHSTDKLSYVNQEILEIYNQ